MSVSGSGSFSNVDDHGAVSVADSTAGPDAGAVVASGGVRRRRPSHAAYQVGFLSETWADYRAGVGDRDALEDTLVRAYLPLVKQISDRMHAGLPRHVEYDEVFQVAMWGLMEAMRRFDPDKAQFPTYATTRIRSKVMDYLRDQDWLSRDMRKQVKDVTKAMLALEQELQRTPTHAEVAARLGVEVSVVRVALANNVVAHVGSLDQVSPAAEEAGYGAVALPSETGNPVDDFEVGEEEALVREVLAEMPERLRHVLCFYHYERLTLQHIGEILGVTESRASQIHARAKEKFAELLLARRASEDRMLIGA